MEFDNEWERRILAVSPRPRFLVSLPMWANFMRFVDDGGITLGERGAIANAAEEPERASVGGLERWGYISVHLGGLRAQARSTKAEGFGTKSGLTADTSVRATPAGLNARAAWDGLVEEIEGRWQGRFGARTVAEMRESVQRIVASLPERVPRSIPMVGPAMDMKVLAPGSTTSPRDDLTALFSQFLVGFAVEAEQRSGVPMVLGANVLRVLGEGAVLTAELPTRSGLSKEAIAMAMTALRRRGVLVEHANPNGRGRLVALTARGTDARQRHLDSVAAVEMSLREMNSRPVEQWHEALDHVMASLSDGLTPPDGGWRSKKPYLAHTEAVIADPAGTLPHFPMVLHRGGWPDGF